MLKPFFVRPYSFTVGTVGNERAEKPASHLAVFDAPGMVWGSNGNTNVYVQCDLGSARAVDFVSVLSANAIAATDWRVRIAGSQANLTAAPTYDSGTLDFISPSITREDGLYHSHLELPSTVTQRWFRIDITSHTGDFEAAAVVIGKKIQCATFPNPGWEHEAEDMGSLDVNRWGIVDQADGLIYRNLRFTLGWPTFSEYETSFRPMIEALGLRKPVYCCFDPDATTARQANSYFGWLRKSPVARGGKIYNRYEIDFEHFSMI